MTSSLKWLPVFVATVALLVETSLANDFNLPVLVLDCAGNPIQGATVQLTGCVDDQTDNSNAKPVLKMTQEDGIAYFTRSNEDRDGHTEDVIQYCWGSANRQCNLRVTALPDTVDAAFVDFQRVRDSCQCDICNGRQFYVNQECPKIVDYPGCPDVAQVARGKRKLLVASEGGDGYGETPNVVTLRPESCPVPYEKSSCIPGVVCGNGEGAYCENVLCDGLYPSQNYFYCSFGGVPQKQLTLSFACPAEGELSLTVSAAQPSQVNPSCGIRFDDTGKLTVRRSDNGIDMGPVGDPTYDVQLTGLPCNGGTVYTVKEDIGVILGSTIQAIFYPSAASSP